MNYLEITNEVIAESGIEDELLTSGTFPTAQSIAPIYRKIKKWVVDAWLDIQDERDNYTWQTGTAIVVLRPRISFYDATDLGGGTWTGNSVSSQTNVELAFAPPFYTDVGNTEGYADIVGSPTTADTLGDDNTLNEPLRIGENIFFPDTLTPNSSYRFKGWGSYNFLDQNEPLDTILTDIADVHHKTVRILSDNSDSTQEFPIQYTPYNDWQYDSVYSYSAPACPMSFTQDTTGRFIFDGPLDKPYRLKFDYTKKPQILTVYSDIPEGLRSEAHMAIVWKALEKYGEYDQRPAVVARARREYKRYQKFISKRNEPQWYLSTHNVRW